MTKATAPLAFPVPGCSCVCYQCCLMLISMTTLAGGVPGLATSGAVKFGVWETLDSLPLILPQLEASQPSGEHVQPLAVEAGHSPGEGHCPDSPSGLGASRP